MPRRLAPWLLLLWTACASPPADPAEAALERACRFLWAQQEADGGWHSRTHGLLRSGQALTPFLLSALLDAPPDLCPAPEGGVARALAFIRAHLDDRGVLGLADPDLMEYPNYATAHALRVLARAGPPADSARIRQMAGYLRSEQFDETRGVAPEHPAYGGWGFGERGLPPGETGHVDLSHTRRVLQALRAAGHLAPDALARARRMLGWLQKRPDDPRLAAAGIDTAVYDGGFFYAPVVLGVNKSPRDDRAPGPEALFLSYATATCDGLLALLAADAAPGEPAVRDALGWLHRHPALEHPPGLPENDPRQWHRVLFFYHLAVRAEAYRALGGPPGWADEMAGLLASRQRDDGAFINPYGAPNKEDDPLLATALAVQALSGVRAARGKGMPDSDGGS